jgi:hypothetical protein
MLWDALMCYLIVGEGLMALGMGHPSMADRKLTCKLPLLYVFCMIATAMWPLFLYKGIMGSK